jgi:hypothetical protein
MRRLRERIEVVLGWATRKGYRKGDNPARWELLKSDRLGAWPARTGL